MSDSEKPLRISIPTVEKDEEKKRTGKTEIPIVENGNLRENVREIKSENYFDFETKTSQETQRIDVNVNENLNKGRKSEIFDLNEAKAVLNRLGNDLKVSTFPKQLGFGSTTGILAGFMSMKVGRLTALAVGGGILLYEIAHHNKIVTKDLETVSKQIGEKKFMDGPKGKKMLDALQHAKKFAGRNKIFTVGFLGGFLIGTGLNQ